jgi:AGZA family xanthine/uracil permease-like MFS transporter
MLLYPWYSIKKSITVGLGVFQALLGFEACKFVVRGDHVLLALGPVSDPTLWLALGGVIMIAVLMILQIRAAMLVGVGFVTLTAWASGMSPWPVQLVQAPTLDATFMSLDFAGYFQHASTTIPCTLV